MAKHEKAPAPEQAVAALLRNQRQFLAFIRKRVESDSVAEEILQAALAKGLEQGRSIREAQSVTAWFYRLLRNALVDHYRARAAEARALERQAREAAREISEDPAFEGQVCACMGELIGTLKPEYAGALQAVELGGATIRQYAAGEGLTSNAATVRLHRARRALRKQLEATCGTCAAHACLDCDCRSSARS